MSRSVNLALQCVAVGLPEPQTEYRFDPDRRWKLDLAYVDQKLGIEIEGGIWMQTREGRSKGHAHPSRFLSDIEKYNKAAVLGWRLLRFTPQMVEDGEALATIERALKGKG